MAHDRDRAEEQCAKRLQRIEALGAFGESLAAKLDAQDDGGNSPGRRASDRSACSRQVRRALDERLTGFVKTDLTTECIPFSRDRHALADVETLDGKRVLLTSLNAGTLKTEAVETRYKSLADIARGFRVLKSVIEIAPVYQRLPERIRAHSQLCPLALRRHRVVRMRLKASDGDLSVERAFDKLRSVHLHKARIVETAVRALTTMDATQLAPFDQPKFARPREAGL